jgi:hypothetical protein
MVVAIVALIVALGGTAVAGGFITKKKAKKVAANQVNKLAPGLSVASAKNADNATNASDSNALGGTAPNGFPKVTQFAYGEISPTGALKPPSASAPPNRGITQVVPQGVTGVYCIKLAFDPTFGTGDGTGASGNGTVAMFDIPATNCGTALPGASATVYVANGAGTSINDDFTVLFGGF